MGDVIENKFYEPPDVTNRSSYDAQYYPHEKSKYQDNNNLPRSDSLYSSQKMHKPSGDATFLFWALVVFIMILALGNIILTFIILGVLRLGNGMDSLQLVSQHNLIKFFGNTDLDFINKEDGRLLGFTDVPVEWSGDGAPVLLHVDRVDDFSGVGMRSPSIDVGVGASVIHSEAFKITHPSNGDVIFSTEFPDFDLPKGVRTLDIRAAQTAKITSPLESSLNIKADTFIRLKGAEGTKIDGMEVKWSADQDIFLKSVNKSITLSGHEGTYVDLKYIPVAKDLHRSVNVTQYKICVCMPGGRLFRVPVTHGTASCVMDGVPASQHPCL